MKPEEREKRDTLIGDLLLEGLNFSQIGRKVGLSRERVRVIARKRGFLRRLTQRFACPHCHSPLYGTKKDALYICLKCDRLFEKSQEAQSPV